MTVRADLRLQQEPSIMKNAVRMLTQERTRVYTLELSTLLIKPSMKISMSCLVVLSRS